MTADPRQLDPLTRGTNAFGLNLLRATPQTESNAALSPVSISCALAMLYTGSDGRTATQLAEVFGFPAGREETETLFRDFLDYVKSICRETPPQQHDAEPEFLEETLGDLVLNIANGVWGQKDWPFQQDYIERMQKSFDAHVEGLQFLPTPETAIETINQWIERHTRGRIRNILDPNLPWGFVRLILTNAVYFKASWEHPFSEAATETGPFYLADGSTSDAEFMNQTETFGYHHSEKKDFKALEMKYGDGKLSMLFLLPGKADGLPALENWLTAERLARISEKIHWQEVDATLPRFVVKSEYRLAETLAGMGAGDVFDQGKADIPHVTQIEPVWVSEVIHKVWIDVNEKGTEAAAVTVIMVATGIEEYIPPMPEEFRADHPFLFFIRDRATGLVLFCGRMGNP